MQHGDEKDATVIPELEIVDKPTKLLHSGSMDKVYLPMKQCSSQSGTCYSFSLVTQEDP